MSSFNLVSEPWIPCRDSTGRRKELGLQDLLLQAHELQDVEGETPLVSASLLRLLFGVTESIFGVPEDEFEWKKRWDMGRFAPEGITSYFARWRNRFDLFDSQHPFMQVAGFTIVDKSGAAKPPTPLSALVHEASAGNNPTLFDHTHDGLRSSMSPGEAARRLVSHQYFAVGGGKGGTSNAFGEHPYLGHGPLMGGVTLLPKGGGLFETLLLNTLLPGYRTEDAQSMSRPVWEWDAVPAPGDWVPTGHLSELAYPSRCVRLTTDENGLVSGVYTAQALKNTSTEVSPWMASQMLKSGDIIPLPLRADRALWRDSHVFLATPSTENDRLDGRPKVIRQLARLSVMHPDLNQVNIDAYGLANDKAKLLTWRHEVFRIPTSLVHSESLSQMLELAVVRSEEIGQAVDRFALPMAKMALFGDSKHPTKGKERDRLVASLSPNPYWKWLDETFRQLLDTLSQDSPEAVWEWEQACTLYGRRAFAHQMVRLVGHRPEFLKLRTQNEARFAHWLQKTQEFPKPGGEDVYPD